MIQRDRGFLSVRFSRAMNSIYQVIYSDKHEISPSLSSWPMKARHGSAHPIFEDFIGICVCKSCQSRCASRTVMSARYKQVRKRFCEVVEPNEHASVSRHPFWRSRGWFRTHKVQLWLEKIDFGTFGDEQFCSSRYRAQGASQVLLSWLGSPSTRVPTRVETFCHDRVDPSHPKPLPKIHQIPKISISIFRTSGDFGVPPASDCRILEAPRLRGCILC